MLDYELMHSKCIVIDTTEEDLRCGKFNYTGPYNTMEECKSDVLDYLINDVKDFKIDSREYKKEINAEWDIIKYTIGGTYKRQIIIGAIRMKRITLDNTDNIKDIKERINDVLIKRWVN